MTWISVVFSLLFSGAAVADEETPAKLRLVEELVLGSDSDEETQIFSATVSVEGAGDGTVYVLDSGNQRILIFEQDGRFRKQFGQMGPGPGEFQEPVAFTLDEKGQLLVFDTGSHKMIVFDANGAFVREVRFHNGIHGVFSPVVIGGGNVAFTAYKIGDQMQMAYDLSVYSPDMKQVQNLYEIPMPARDWHQADQPGFWPGFLKDQFALLVKGFPVKAAVGNQLVTALTNQYQLTLRNGMGNQKSQVTRKQKPRLLSDEAKLALCEPIWQNLAANPAISQNLTQGVFNQAVRESEDLVIYSAIFGMVSHQDGFAVLTGYDVIEKTGQWEFFDNQGKLTGSAPYAGPYYFFSGRGPFIYAAGPDDMDDLAIRRFRVERL